MKKYICNKAYTDDCNNVNFCKHREYHTDINSQTYSLWGECYCGEGLDDEKTIKVRCVNIKSEQGIEARQRYKKIMISKRERK